MLIADMLRSVDNAAGDKFQVRPVRALEALSIAHLHAFSRDIPAFLQVSELPMVEDSKGPYPFPILCRSAQKVLAVEPGADPMLDGAAVACRFDQVVGKSVTLASVPDMELEYWLSYYARPQALSAIDDDAKVLLPEEWHDSMVSGAVALLDPDNAGKSRAMVLDPIFAPFWMAMECAHDGREPIRSVGGW